MARIPRRKIKITRDGVQYEDSIDLTQYTIYELTCAALRDVGKLITRRFKQNFYKQLKKRTGKVTSYCQYWVRKNLNYQEHPDVLIGIKPGGFYGGFQELGTEYQPKLGILQHTTIENIDEIVRIEGEYLTALNEESPLSNIVLGEGEYTGGADE